MGGGVAAYARAVVSFYFYCSFCFAACCLCVRWCVVVVLCCVVLCTFKSKVWVSAVEFGSRHWLLSATLSAPVSAPVPELQFNCKHPPKTHESRLFSLVE